MCVSKKGRGRLWFLCKKVETPSSFECPPSGSSCSGCVVGVVLVKSLSSSYCWQLMLVYSFTFIFLTIVLVLSFIRRVEVSHTYYVPTLIDSLNNSERWCSARLSQCRMRPSFCYLRLLLQPLAIISWVLPWRAFHAAPRRYVLSYHDSCYLMVRLSCDYGFISYAIFAGLVHEPFLM